MALKRIDRFRDYWRNEGPLSALRETKRYLESAFGWQYWRRQPLYLALVKASITVRRRANSDDVTDADPFKIAWVDPDEIRYAVVDRHKHEWGVVTDDRLETKPIEDCETYRAIRQHFVDGDDHPMISESREELYRSMKNEGYIPQKELQGAAQLLPFHYREFEIGVDIDADGDLYWTGAGRNRLCVAKVLGLDEIAVQVHARHREWQERRDEIRTAKTIDDLSERTKRALDHPDLADLIPESGAA